jgi:hypothetical protein
MHAHQCSLHGRSPFTANAVRDIRPSITDACLPACVRVVCLLACVRVLWRTFVGAGGEELLPQVLRLEHALAVLVDDVLAEQRLQQVEGTATRQTGAELQGRGTAGVRRGAGVVEGGMWEHLHERGVHGPGQVELRDVLALLQRGESRAGVIGQTRPLTSCRTTRGGFDASLISRLEI